MITLRIYLGETAEQIGISEFAFQGRKAVVDRFVAQWDGVGDFMEAFAAWAKAEAEEEFAARCCQDTTDVKALVSSLGIREYKAEIVAAQSPKVPAITTRAVNLSKALFRFVVEGMPVESKAEATRRLEICETNECGYFDGSVCRHTQCGCFSKIKTFLASEHCPLGKW